MKPEQKKKKKEKWIKPRHKIVRNLLIPIIYLLTVLMYGVKVRRFKEQGDRQYLILMNHQTAFDQFFIAMAFKGAVYYIATEDIFSLGWLSSLLRYFLAPIPIKKQTTDTRAVMNCMCIAKEGGTIALAPEGNRTYSGRTCYINPAIMSLARALKLPVAIFRIEDGYGVQPRWSDKTRRGKMSAGVTRVIEPEEYKAMSNEELLQEILKELYVDENRVTGTFRHKNLAHYMERAIYVCPWCGLSEFESAGDEITCKKCGRRVRYLPTKEMEGVGFDFPFRFFGEWYDYQNEFVHGLDPAAYCDAPMYCDRARVSEVIVYEKKIVLCEDAAMELYGDRVELRGADGFAMTLPFSEIKTATVLGRNKLNIYHGDKIYQFKGDKRFNALKYMNMFYHYDYVAKGAKDEEFFGL
ncbi:MAG: 1-acyl-sn-glycerol-3-phosphate acyltransferase [Oscillospiraceae bacterium]|nr:1-acyl-sn-glycerol-3-phosphate acyltransferase [Oscillospiraceae bacterium]